jgi:uncharacterized protein YbcI
MRGPMQHAHASPHGELAAEISRNGVRILHDYTGRGPTKARTLINHDAIAIVFQDTLTKGERRLVELGLTEQVLNGRRAFQGAMKEELIAMVEECSGRKVAAFLSDNHVNPDIAVETFILEEVGSEETESRAQVDVS